MTIPRHHPAADTLGAYATGALEPGFALVVAAHLDGCAQCRRDVGAFEASSGAALKDLPSAELAPDALSRAMAKLDGATPDFPTRADQRSFLERLPLKPKRWVAPGVWVAAVDTPHAPEDRVYLLSVGPGGATAMHSHTGLEFCTVLKGAFRDGGDVFGAGDFALAEGEHRHQPVIHGDEECVCLFATEGRLKPAGWIGKLAFALADV